MAGQFGSHQKGPYVSFPSSYPGGANPVKISKHESLSGMVVLEGLKVTMDDDNGCSISRCQNIHNCVTKVPIFVSSTYLIPSSYPRDGDPVTSGGGASLPGMDVLGVINATEDNGNDFQPPRKSKKGKYKSAEDVDHMPAMDERDNMRKEIANELEAAKKIISHLKKALQVMDAEKELERSWTDVGESWKGKDAFSLLYGPINVKIRSIEVVLGGTNTTSRDPACPEGEWSDGNIGILYYVVYLYYKTCNRPSAVEERWSIEVVLGGTNTTSRDPACPEGEWSDGNIDLAESWKMVSALENRSRGVPVNVDRGFSSGSMFVNVRGRNTTSRDPACPEGEWSDGNIDLAESWKMVSALENRSRGVPVNVARGFSSGSMFVNVRGTNTTSRDPACPEGEWSDGNIDLVQSRKDGGTNTTSRDPACPEGEWSDGNIDLAESGKDVFVLLYGPVNVQIRSIEVVLWGTNTTSMDLACPEGEWSDWNIDLAESGKDVFILLYRPVNVQIRSIEVVLGGTNTTSMDLACPEGEWSDGIVFVGVRPAIRTCGGRTPLQVVQCATRGIGQTGTLAQWAYWYTI
ncbi:hypothetical protein F5J12DRAFT_786587 [Pisolithus orientalis]|uniref:uncharacterized protein n=1 Tax=Pisolithus orientalis TaxID=936130 RepID=UPI0022247DB1|nr:uncharacterized protein F5J12DRAFT_786587 [Pisolithus orientalis]KAI5989777.1 hypothetical protein F5J12DRAFT_786587 [Pisolithus orientalis]